MHITRDMLLAPETTNVIGTDCLNTSYLQLTGTLQQACREPGKTLAVDFTNVHIVTMRRVNQPFARTLQAFDYFVPDSQVLYFAVRLLGGRMLDRVYGPTFMRECVKRSPKPFTHYLLGGSTECLQKLIEFFENLDESITIVGSHDGYFPEDRSDAILEEINRLSPDFIWVGLGTPKQQRWIFENRAKIKRGNILAVGFAFDVNAGTKTDAPVWMQKCALTWVYRLLSEPRRLAGRYFIYNSLFLWFFSRQVVPLKARRLFSSMRA